MTVDGMKCYRAVQEISSQGQKVKHISYTFKKGDILYNHCYCLSSTHIESGKKQNKAQNKRGKFPFLRV